MENKQNQEDVKNQDQEKNDQKQLETENKQNQEDVKSRIRKRMIKSSKKRKTSKIKRT